MRAIERRLDATGETQVSLTDPDCRAMATTSKQPRVVGYNVQSVVETKHHLIVVHEVTNHGYDRDALAMMAHAARDVMACDTIELPVRAITRARRLSPVNRPALRLPSPSRLRPMLQQKGASIGRISSIWPRTMPMPAQLASGSPTTTRTRIPARHFAIIGRTLAAPA